MCRLVPGGAPPQAAVALPRCDLPPQAHGLFVWTPSAPSDHDAESRGQPEFPGPTLVAAALPWTTREARSALPSRIPNNARARQCLGRRLPGWPSDQAPKMARSTFSKTDKSGYCGWRRSWIRSAVSLGAGRRSSHPSQRGSLTSPPQGCSSPIASPIARAGPLSGTSDDRPASVTARPADRDKAQRVVGAIPHATAYLKQRLMRSPSFRDAGGSSPRATAPCVSARWNSRVK